MGLISSRDVTADLLATYAAAFGRPFPAGLLPTRPLASDVLGLRLHSLDSAIARALREWERDEPLAAR